MNKKNILLVLGLASALLVTGCPGTTAAETDAEALKKLQASVDAAKATADAAKLTADAAKEAVAALPKPGQGQQSPPAGKVDVTALIQKAKTSTDFWAFTYEEMCNLLAAPGDLEKKITEPIKANRDLINRVAGYSIENGTLADAAVPAELDKKSAADLLKIYTSQSALPAMSSEAKINGDKGNVTFSQVDSRFYTELLKKVATSTDTATLGIDKITEPYDISWYFGNVIFPVISVDGKTVLNDSAKTLAANVATFVGTDANLKNLATLIKNAAAKGKTIYSEDLYPGYALFNDAGQPNWDVWNKEDNSSKMLFYLEAKAIAFIIRTNDANLITGLEALKPGATYVAANKLITIDYSTTNKYTFGGTCPITDTAVQFLVSRYYDLLDLMTINSSLTVVQDYKFSKGITFDEPTMVFHAFSTPRMLAAVAAASATPKITIPAANSNDLLKGPVVYPNAKDANFTKELLTWYFLRRRVEIADIAAKAKSDYLGGAAAVAINPDTGVNA